MLDATTEARPRPDERFRELGEIVWLAAHSPAHREMQIDEIGPLFLAPLAHGQLRRWSRGPTLVALATWAWLGETEERTYLETGKVPDGAWGSGDRLWFIDVIAPFGDARAVTRDLRQVIPPGCAGRSARWHADGTLRKIGRFAAPCDPA